MVVLLELLTALVFAVVLHLSLSEHVCSSIFLSLLEWRTSLLHLLYFLHFYTVFARRGYSSRSSHKVTELTGVCEKIKNNDHNIL